MRSSIETGFGSFETTLSLINRDALRLPDEKNYLLFAYVGFVLMLTQGVLYRRLANRLSEVTFMTLGLVFMTLLQVVTPIRRLT